MTQEGGTWWEFDPDERPVPLDEDGQGVAEVAEEIVEAERQSIMRQDTEPTLATLRALAESKVLNTGEPARSLLPLGIALLVVGCAAMFSLGWSQGAAAQEAKESIQPVTRTTGTDDSAGFNKGSTTRTRKQESEEVSKR